MAKKATGTPDEIDVDALSDDEVAAKLEEMASDAEDIDPEADLEPIADPEPEPVPARSDDPVNAESGDPDPKPAKQETVPFATFEHERLRRKTAADDLVAANEKNAVLMDRMNQLAQAQQASQQPQQQAPTVPGADDPVGRIDMLWERSQEQDRQAEEYSRQSQEHGQYQEQVQQAYASAEADMAVAGPDANQAYLALKASYREEYKAMGYTDQQAGAAYAELEASHLLTSQQRGIPASDYIKALATSRGWQYAEQQAPTNGVAPVQQNVADVAAQAVANEATRQKALSLGSAGGATAEIGEITGNQLLAMSDKDFSKYLEDHGSVAVAMGGERPTEW